MVMEEHQTLKSKILKSKHYNAFIFTSLRLTGFTPLPADINTGRLVSMLTDFIKLSLIYNETVPSLIRTLNLPQVWGTL